MDYVTTGTKVWTDAKGAADAANAGLGGILAGATMLASDIPLPSVVAHLEANVESLSATGAAAGSIIPGIGTVIGAAIGAIVGIIEAIGQGLTNASDPRPEWLKKVELVPTPHDASGGPPTAQELAAGDDLHHWHYYANGLDPFSMGLGLTPLDHSREIRAKAETLWSSTDPTQGQIVLELGSDGATRAAIARFKRWTNATTVHHGTFAGVIVSEISDSPIWLPDQGDTFGVWLHQQYWTMAAQGLSDLDAYHYALALQWVMHTAGGDEHEPHLMWLAGYLKGLLARQVGNLAGVANAVFKANALRAAQGGKPLETAEKIGLGALALAALKLLFV